MNRLFWCIYCNRRNSTQESAIKTHMKGTSAQDRCTSLPPVPDPMATPRKHFDARGWLWYEHWDLNYTLPAFVGLLDGDAAMMHKTSGVVWECRDGATKPYCRAPDPRAASSLSLRLSTSASEASTNLVPGEFETPVIDSVIVSQIEAAEEFVFAGSIDTCKPSLSSSSAALSRVTPPVSSIGTSFAPTSDLDFFSDAAQAGSSPTGINGVLHSSSTFSDDHIPQREASASRFHPVQESPAYLYPLGLAPAWPPAAIVGPGWVAAATNSAYPTTSDNYFPHHSAAFAHERVGTAEAQPSASKEPFGFDITANPSPSSSSTVGIPSMTDAWLGQSFGQLPEVPFGQGLHCETQVQPAGSLARDNESDSAGNTNTHAHGLYQFPAPGYALKHWMRSNGLISLVEPEVTSRVPVNSDYLHHTRSTSAGDASLPEIEFTATLVPMARNHRLDLPFMNDGGEHWQS